MIEDILYVKNIELTIACQYFFSQITGNQGLTKCVSVFGHLQFIQSEVLTASQQSGCHYPVVAQLSLNYVKAYPSLTDGRWTA